jgi:hypothetical protein
VPAASPRTVSSVPSRRSRALVTTLGVLAASALGLRTLDALPGWLSGVPRGVHVCASLDEAQARTGVQLGALRSVLTGWRPVTVRVTLHPIPAVAVTLLRDHDGADLVLYRSRGGGVPTGLRPALAAFHAITVPLVQGRTAILRAEVRPTGGVLQELEWTTGGQHTVMRFAGRTVELLRLARLLADKDP